MIKLTFIIGYGANTIHTLREVLNEGSEKFGIEYVVTRDHQADKYIDFIMDSDIIFIYASELPQNVENAVKRSKSKITVSASDTLMYLSKGDSHVIYKTIEYYKVGGKNNLRNLVYYLLKQLGVDVHISDVEYVPWHGIWHPKLGLFTDTSKYLEKYYYRDKPLVGIIFYRTLWLYDGLDIIRELVLELEKEGLGVLPVFVYGFKDEHLNTPSTEDSIRKFFFVNGSPVIDVAVTLTSFFLLEHGKWYRSKSRDRFKGSEGIELLKKLNIPIIKLISAFNMSVNEWLDSPHGIDYLSQVYQIIMPEVDGLIEPIFYVASTIDEYGARKYEVYKDHTRFIARRIKKWVNLKRKKPGERKIAIVINNPPCKGLEANIAVGLGLDVPESIVRFLSRLRELGYNVGEYIPQSGKELIKLILDRKAFSEFRWTSVDMIVKSGGALGYVDKEQYLKWFNELPNNVRKELVEDWGDPIDVLSGNVSRELVGMVYNGKFVIPGVRFGNIVIIPQPKFGCAGPACDGKVCRILHNPNIKPPHQWLAVYRWITRVFNADLIIHFGTHGTLEFRPGKGVGLSVYCWPEISIDDTPFLYIYAVVNPMEGVLAKRRGYAVIVDHLYPPMSTPKVFNELEELLYQYSRAKNLGEFERARIIFDEILSKAREMDIDIKDGNGDMDSVIEDIHRYIDMVRNTQINLGLHIYGYPPEDLDKLAEYVCTVMMNDTVNYPSILRVLAEYLDLNYDELRDHPEKVNRFGVTNREMLNILRNAAVGIIRELISVMDREGDVTDERIIGLVEDYLRKYLGDNSVKA